jgi:hypothetical protein
MRPVPIPEVLDETAPPESPSSSTHINLLVACLGLVAALAVLPLPTVGQTPEIASILAIAAVALLAGQRWALPVVVLADVALIGALWPRAVAFPPEQLAQLGVLLGLAGALPGVIALGRAAPGLAEMIFGRVSRRLRHASFAVMLLCAVVWIAAPLM